MQGEIENIAGKKLVAKKTILLVDDDEDEHEIFLSALKTLNKDYNFISAGNCDQALFILKEFDPDYIFIDVNMPKVNGMVCLEEIKKISRLADVPVYMYSTGINEKEGQKALKLGALDYVVKPNNISSLSTLLTKILK